MIALEGISDAEEKRKIFRKTFYETLGEAVKQEECRFLIQGTIKADIDETKQGIKTQHNILDQIGIDPEKTFGFTVVEPIKSLYKYQVREVARYLNVPPPIAERQPFPGPGLSVTVCGYFCNVGCAKWRIIHFCQQLSFKIYFLSDGVKSVFKEKIHLFVMIQFSQENIVI